jgi:hypothetical protein
LLGKMGVRRILVGDAGALIYASDRPGLDMIGLGGYHQLPFARSGVHGLGASLELMEHMASDDRPDVMAIYPSWWHDLPTYFGRYLTAVPVRGNVICGGSEKVLYQADWRPLDRAGAPRTLLASERVVDELDVADLLSEQAHDYRVSPPPIGFVQFRVLADPARPTLDLFDAGRRIPTGSAELARMRSPRARGRLIVRVAPERRSCVRVRIDKASPGELCFERQANRWQEVTMPLPHRLGSSFELELEVTAGPSVHYHLWVVENRSARE